MYTASHKIQQTGLPLHLLSRFTCYLPYLLRCCVPVPVCWPAVLELPPVRSDLCWVAMRRSPVSEAGWVPAVPRVEWHGVTLRVWTTMQSAGGSPRIPANICKVKSLVK
jgi:hypothetical protein